MICDLEEHIIHNNNPHAIVESPEKTVTDMVPSTDVLLEIEVTDEQPHQEAIPTYIDNEVSIYIRYGFVYKKYHHDEKKAREEFKRLRLLAQKTGNFEWNGWTVRVIDPLYYDPLERTLVLPFAEGVELGSIRSHRTTMEIERALSKWFVFLLSKGDSLNISKSNDLAKNNDHSDNTGNNTNTENSGVTGHDYSGNTGLPGQTPPLIHGDLDNSNILVDEKSHIITLIDPGVRENDENGVCFDIATRLISHIRNSVNGFREFYYLSRAFLSDELLSCPPVTWQRILRQIPELLKLQYKTLVPVSRLIAATAYAYYMMVTLIKVSHMLIRRQQIF